MAKRLLRENTGPAVSLVGNRFFQGLMQQCNTPDPDTGLSPAQVLFGRPVKDFMPIFSGKIRPQEGWRLGQEDREKVLRVRYSKENLSEHTKKLPKLSAGYNVMIQYQWRTPKVAKRWDRSGVVLKVENYDKSGPITQSQYFKVKTDICSAFLQKGHNSESKSTKAPRCTACL